MLCSQSNPRKTTLRESDGSLLLVGSGRLEAAGDRLAGDFAAFAGGSLRDTDGWIAKIDTTGAKVWEATGADVEIE